MSVKWTDKQLEAITERGKNILVSAAAGSGKTTVLVERIIRMITDSNNPVSVDRLLVLTFTEAAAAEMKRKIADAINKKLEENPNDKWLREQSVKVSSAAISTIDAFCMRIITNNAHLTTLPADFSMIDATENKVLLRQAVDNIMESYYSRIDRKTGFRELVTGWSDIKGDENLRRLIIDIHIKSKSLAYPGRWFSHLHKNGYKVVRDDKSFENSLWAEQVKEIILWHYANICEALERIRFLTERDIPMEHGAYSYYVDMYEDFKAIGQSYNMDDDKGFVDFCNAITGYKIKSCPRAKDIEDVIKPVHAIRDKVLKENIKSIVYFMSTFDEDNVAKVSLCEPVARTLCNLVRLTEKVHQSYKRERSVIDFNDLEHGLLKLLVDKKGQDTQLCKKMREYYHEILVDEFQDTNGLQYEIFSRISRNNLFMVGDVKQSIYRFRNADPGIFLSLYKKYINGDGGHLICLSENFRSRSQVVDSINDIFDSVMSERCGEIDYKGEERLVCGASYPENTGCETELMITDLSDTESKDELMEELMTESVEARAVAERIKKLVCVDKLKVYDKEEECMRDVRYGDIAVICRSSAEKIAIENELTEVGVSSMSDNGQRYLTSVEVSAVLAFLQIIDNPVQDIPLIAVMRSVMFKFSVSELAYIRTCAKGRFFNAVEKAAETDKKTADFLDYLNELRDCSKYMGVDEIVRKICADKQYYSLVGAMPGGELRKANVKLFLEKCADFEKGAFKGIFNFVKYIEMLREKKEDFVPAKDNSGEMNSVKIMTIHKSKGLEYPVVVLFKAGKRFNREEFKNKILCDVASGLGFDYIDTRQRVKFSVPTREIIKKKIELSSIAEEMRLLYVALTRAKEKLIISASVGARDNNWMQAEFDEGGRVLSYSALSARNMRDWVYSAVINHPSGGYLRSLADRREIVPSLDKCGTFNVYPVDFSEKVDDIYSVSGESEKEYDDINIEERLDYLYPYSGLAEIPVKMSVSDVKRRQTEENVYIGNLMPAPKLASDGEELNAAERGTITHYVMQHIDEKKTDSYEDVEEQIDNMVKASLINTEQKNAVDVESIYKFFQSSIGRRLKASDRIEREFDFYMQVDYGEVDKTVNTEFAEDVILQGISDCFFYEDGEIVLVDFKTDNVSQATAPVRAEAYRVQMEYYSKGISEILGVAVKEKYLYFLSCGELIEM